MDGESVSRESIEEEIEGYVQDARYFQREIARMNIALDMVRNRIFDLQEKLDRSYQVESENGQG